MKTQLLCTFCSKRELDDSVELIKLGASIVFDKIYVFENMEQVRMASNAIIQQDQWLDINDKYIIQRTAAQLDPDYYGAPFGMGADEETGIRPIMDQSLDDSMEELLLQSRQSLTLPDEE